MSASSRREGVGRMATYTGGAQAKPGVGAMLWLTVVAFVVAAVVVIALVATQSGTPLSSHPVTGQKQGQIDVPVGKGGPLQPRTVPLGSGICAQCAP
jgi:hypothetical protein